MAIMPRRPLPAIPGSSSQPPLIRFPGFPEEPRSATLRARRGGDHESPISRLPSRSWPLAPGLSNLDSLSTSRFFSGTTTFATEPLAPLLSTYRMSRLLVGRDEVRAELTRGLANRHAVGDRNSLAPRPFMIRHFGKPRIASLA